MNTHVNQIISLLIDDVCFTAMKDQYGKFDHRTHQYIFHVLHDLKTKENIDLQLHVLLPIKSIMSQNEDLLQYFNALINAVHMDAIDKKLQSINLKCDIIHNQMFATAIKHGYQAEMELAGGRHNKNNSFIKDINKALERIKQFISKLYPMMNDIDYISFETNVIRSTFKRENAFNIVIEKISNTIEYDAEKIIEYKKSLITFK